jgi:hypothetical protein
MFLNQRQEEYAFFKMQYFKYQITILQNDEIRF